MKLTNAQFGALSTLHLHGDKEAIEIIGPPAMSGVRSTKLECYFMERRTMAALEDAGLIRVTRALPQSPKDATGRSGRARRKIVIAITHKGRAALSACMKVG